MQKFFITMFFLICSYNTAFPCTISSRNRYIRNILISKRKFNSFFNKRIYPLLYQVLTFQNYNSSVPSTSPNSMSIYYFPNPLYPPNPSIYTAIAIAISSEPAFCFFASSFSSSITVSCGTIFPSKSLTTFSITDGSTIHI